MGEQAVMAALAVGVETLSLRQPALQERSKLNQLENHSIFGGEQQ
jgi:hypothetical protein